LTATFDFTSFFTLEFGAAPFSVFIIHQSWTLASFGVFIYLFFLTTGVMHYYEKDAAFKI